MRISFVASAWNRFWFVEGPAHGLALFRMMLGFYWLVRWGAYWPDVALVFSEEGMHFPLFDDSPHNGGLIGNLYAWLNQPAPLWVAWTLFVVWLGSAAGMMVGLFTRQSIGVFLALTTYYYFLYIHHLNSSFARMTFLLTFLLLLSPSGEVLSLDAWRKRRRGGTPRNSVPLWSARAMCVQVAFVYVGTALFKVMSPYWDEGEMIATSFMGDWSTSLGFAIVRSGLSWGFYDLAVLLTILFEMWAPFLLFSRRFQGAFFLFGTLFHLGIALTLSIWQFMFLPMTYVLFLDPSRVRRGTESALARCRREH